jgi:hypothetical protein
MTGEEATDALDRNLDLVERLRGGDVWALPSLVEAMTGGKMVEARIIHDTRPQ